MSKKVGLFSFMPATIDMVTRDLASSMTSSMHSVVAMLSLMAAAGLHSRTAAASRHPKSESCRRAIQAKPGVGLLTNGAGNNLKGSDRCQQRDLVGYECLYNPCTDCKLASAALWSMTTTVPGNAVCLRRNSDV